MTLERSRTGPMTEGSVATYERCTRPDCRNRMPGYEHAHLRWVDQATESEHMTPVEFLRARLDERKERIERLKVERWELDGGHIFGVTSADEIVWVGDHDELGAYLAADCPPETALAEVDAKRRIVDDCADILADTGAGPAVVGLAWAVLYDLASVHADHPDYDESWRP